jgi:hypothetical protein
MEKKFVFRGKEYHYEFAWVEQNELFVFCFGYGELVDENGEEYFIRCQWRAENEDDETLSPWYFDRWYEYDCVDATYYFNDRLTEDECQYIISFVKQLMGIAVGTRYYYA